MDCNGGLLIVKQCESEELGLNNSVSCSSSEQDDDDDMDIEVEDSNDSTAIHRILLADDEGDDDSDLVMD